MHAFVAATLGYGSTHKEPFDKLEKGGTLLWPGQSDQVLRNDASGSTVEVSAPADAARRPRRRRAATRRQGRRLVVAAELLQRVQDAGGESEPEGPASGLRVERV